MTLQHFLLKELEEDDGCRSLPFAFSLLVIFFFVFSGHFQPQSIHSAHHSIEHELTSPPLAVPSCPPPAASAARW